IACNALHTIEERASRWLLTLRDQARRDEFPLTHEFLAMMLGVRRQGVTVVTVLDREGLESASCECLGVDPRALRAGDGVGDGRWRGLIRQAGSGFVKIIPN